MPLSDVRRESEGRTEMGDRRPGVVLGSGAIEKEPNDGGVDAERREHRSP